MQALEARIEEFRCSVFRVQSAPPSEEKKEQKVKSVMTQSFLCILSFSKESMRL